MSGCKSGQNEPIISEPECFGDFVGINLRNHHYNLPRCKCKNSRFFESVSNICSFQIFTVLAIHSDLLGWLSDPSERFFVKTLLGYGKGHFESPGCQTFGCAFFGDSLQCRILWATVQVAETLAITIKKKGALLWRSSHHTDFWIQGILFPKICVHQNPYFLAMEKTEETLVSPKCAYLLKPMCCLPPKKMDEIPFGIPANTNSICFHALGDSRPPNSRGLSTHYKDNPAENPSLACFTRCRASDWPRWRCERLW